MSSIQLKNLSLSIFGESHGEMIGGVITGLPAGQPLDLNLIRQDMNRRRPGKNLLSTQRSEGDLFQIVSGYLDGVTTGAPLTIIIRNTDAHSKDYSYLKNIPRPSHSDYAAFLKYHGHNDVRGGGHFSGRLTAPLVCLGSICKQFLMERNIQITAHISRLGTVVDKPMVQFTPEDFAKLSESEIPAVVAVKEMEEIISQARENLDSVGGVVECGIFNLPAGFGGPLFDGVEGQLAKLIFGIPAVKGVEFGLGFDFGKLHGSSANDPFTVEDGKIRTKTNHCGGILGGITNGEPLIFRAAFKPTPSIYQPQDSVKLKELENTTLIIKGRHDPCITLRAVPVVECVAAFGILDYLI